jgi:hypothetical protein
VLPTGLLIGTGAAAVGAVGHQHTLSLFALQAGLCLVGCLQLVAFTSLLFQLPHLYGRHGVQPISTVLEAAQQSKPGTAAW